VRGSTATAGKKIILLAMVRGPQILGSLERADARQASGVADAVRIYRAVLERKPQQPQASCALGVNDASADHNEEVLSLLEHDIEVNPIE
jgi:hypothetical protein